LALGIRCPYMSTVMEIELPSCSLFDHFLRQVGQTGISRLTHPMSGCLPTQID
jgi:hypothetical protein